MFARIVAIITRKVLCAKRQDSRAIAMSVRQGSDWSGLVTVSSLPEEFRERQRMNIAMVEAARHPNRIRESRSGLPVHNHYSINGQTAMATVNTLAVPYAPPMSAAPSIGPGPARIDAWDHSRIVQGQFREFARDLLNGRMQVREGPNPGGVSGLGIPQWSRQWPHVDTDFPHGAVMARRRRSRVAYVPGEARDTDDWIGDEEEETRVHDGSCRQAHPGQTHSDWASSEEEEEHRLRARTSERYLRLLVTESSHQPNCPLRRWAIRKLR